MSDDDVRAHRPRKRFGQHFLHDPAVVERIVAAIAPAAGDRVVEIGPGLGVLTTPLLASGCELHAVEVDRDLAARLERAAPAGARLRVHRADALRFDLAALGGPLRVVGNLPYNISTPLLFRLIAQRAAVRDMHFMLQREVVDRLVAAPGTGAWGRLGVMVGLHCEATRLFNLGAGAFRPAPRVESAFVRLAVRAEPAAPVRSPDTFARVVAQAFSRRRKTLRNALAGLVDADAMRAAGIDPGRRPETLDVAEFAALADLAETPSAAP